MPFDVVELDVLTPHSSLGGLASRIDARQHSPPRFTPLSPRAPPSSPTAWNSAGLPGRCPFVEARTV